MNCKDKSDSTSHPGGEEKLEDILHYQFFPEDRIRTVYSEDPLPCPKKPKKGIVHQNQKLIKKRMLKNERTILKKEWNKWQRQLMEKNQTKLALKNLTKKQIPRNSKYLIKTFDSINARTNPQPYNVNSNAVSLPSLRRHLTQMSVPELVKYKNDLNSYLKSVCIRNLTSDELLEQCLELASVQIPEVVKNENVRKSLSAKSFDSPQKAKNERLKSKLTLSPNNIVQNLTSCDDELNGQLKMFKQLFMEGLGSVDKKESNSSDANIKALMLLMKKVDNYKRIYNGPPPISHLSRSKHNKIVQAHKPPVKISSTFIKRSEPHVKECTFPINKSSDLHGDESSEKISWTKETIKNTKKLLKRYIEHQVVNKSKNMMNMTLSNKNKIWLNMENLLADRNNIADQFLSKAMAELCNKKKK